MTTFMATQWDSAEQKQKFFQQFQRFVLSDFKRTIFPKWFYRQLSMTFGHIAHFDQDGFYATFFKSLSGKIHFLQQTVEWNMGGDPAYTYSDVERALKAWVLEVGLIRAYCAKQEAVIEQEERATLSRLQAKYAEVR